MSLPSNCRECGASNLRRLTFYKRYWDLCGTCGAGSPEQRDRYPFAFLPGPGFKKPPAQDEQSIYDYFVQESHIRYSIGTAHEFIKQYIDPNGIELRGKSVLDVSGGNGHFLKVIEGRGAHVAMTEINKLAIDHARQTHGFDVYEFNFNQRRINNVVTKKFDIVMLRAAIMFCNDLRQLVGDLTSILNPGGLVIVNHSVIPTLGVMLRTQLDEFSYAILRQPETVVGHFEKAGFRVTARVDETDPSLYAYDHDLNNWWLMVWSLYEVMGARKLRDFRKFPFPARDRRRSTMIFQRA